VNTPLDEIFEQFFAGNRSPGYGVSVTAVSPDGATIDLRVTFLSGREYCCAEPGCHFGWARLRRIANSRGIEFPSPLTVRWHGVVEKGARLSANVRAGGPAESAGYEYDEVFQENLCPRL
jgi:hypothetical protein